MRIASRRSVPQCDPLALGALRQRHRGPRLTARLLVLGMGLALIAGCSSLRLGYDNLPTLVRWQVDRYVDLDDAQEARLDQRLREAHQWHRESELPRYVRWIERIRRDAAGDITPQRVADWRAEALAAWPPLVERLAPAVAELGVSLQPAQLGRLERELAAENREREREYFGGRTAEAVRAGRVKRWQERGEQFMGGLTAPQLQLLGDRAQREPVSAADSDWWAMRLARQRVWVGLMRELATERPPIDEATRRTRAALLTIFAPADPMLKARDASSARASDAFVADLLRRMSPAQQRQLDQTLRGYGDDVARLAAAAAPRRGTPAAALSASPVASRDGGRSDGRADGTAGGKAGGKAVDAGAGPASD